MVNVSKQLMFATNFNHLKISINHDSQQDNRIVRMLSGVLGFFLLFYDMLFLVVKLIVIRAVWVFPSRENTETAFSNGYSVENRVIN